MYFAVLVLFRLEVGEDIAGYYGVEAAVSVERPPKLAMGEMATPVCFELAKRLKRAPRVIAQEIAAALGAMEGVARVEVAGGGYLNAFLDRGAYLAAVARGAGREAVAAASSAPKVIVEHTNINPN